MCLRLSTARHMEMWKTRQLEDGTRPYRAWQMCRRKVPLSPLCQPGPGSPGRRGGRYHPVFLLLHFHCVNGRKALVYPEILKDFFERAETQVANKAYPYDQTIGAVYPMPTVFRLNKQDASGTTVRAARIEITVHVGELASASGGGTTPEADGIHNGNRLWVDYPLDMTGTDVKYLTFAVTGKISGKTMYYVLRTDADGSTYYFTPSRRSVQET